MLFLDYPVTRPLRLSRWGAALFYLFAILVIAVVTVINIVAVGYDPVVFTSTEFNATTTFWYDSFIPKVWQPQGRNCAPATIKIAECTFPLNIVDPRRLCGYGKRHIS